MAWISDLRLLTEEPGARAAPTQRHSVAVEFPSLETEYQNSSKLKAQEFVLTYSFCVFPPAPTHVVCCGFIRVHEIFLAFTGLREWVPLPHKG